MKIAKKTKPRHGSLNIKSLDFIDAIPDAVCITDMNHNIVGTNKAMEDVFEIGKGKLLKIKAMDLADEQEKKQIEKVMFNLLKTGVAQKIEVRGKIGKAKGRIYWLNFALTKDEKDKPSNIVTIARDITEQKNAEKALMESEEKYRKIIECAGDAIIIADVETGNIIDANRKAGDLLGVPIEKIIGMHQSELHPVGDREFYKDRFKERVIVGAGTNKLSFVQNRNGYKIPVQISSSLFDINGKKMLLGIFRDITDLKKIENALRDEKIDLEKIVSQVRTELGEAIEKLENSKRLADIGTLASTVAHDLRNPLGVIKAAAYNIEIKSRDPSLKSHINSINKKIAESDQIIKNLLSYSMIRMPNYESINIVLLLDECLKYCKEKYRGWDVNLKTEYGVLKGGFIEADAMHMTGLFTNLLDNAYQAFSDKRGIVEVTAALNSEKSMAEITVKDNGAGIDKKDIDKVFNPFFTKKAKGIGLGLTVCKQVVGLHGGRMDLESEKGKGTTIRVYIPIKRAV